MGNSQGIRADSETDSSSTTTQKNIHYGHVDYAVLEYILRTVRSDRVRHEFLKTPEDHYTEKSEVRIWATTFNLNGRKPPEKLDFRAYLKQWESSWPEREKSDMRNDRRPDIYLLGFQEAIPLTAQNVITGWTTIPMGWDRAIDKSLNKWKKFDELVHSPLAADQAGDDIIDKYHSMWTGAPSANLSSSLKQALNEGKGSSDNRQGNQKTGHTVSSDVESHGPVSIKDDKGTFPTILESSSLPKPPPKLKFTKEPKQKEKRTEKKEEFVQIVSHQLVGLYVSGWARKSFLKRISGIQVTTVATGALGYLANKGAIAVRMRIDDSAVVFLTSHLASGSHEGDELKRNLDFSEIMRRTQFPREMSLVKVKREDGSEVEDFSSRPEGLPENPSIEVKRSFVGGCWGGLRTLRELDNIIWVGDLNYRINGETKEVIKLIREDKLNVLLEVDQLSIEKAAGNVFQGFKEAPIDFPPTYKYMRGTDTYTGELDDESSDDSEVEHDDKEDFVNLSKQFTSFPVVKSAGKSHSIDTTSIHTAVGGGGGPPSPEVLKTVDRLGLSLRNFGTNAEDNRILKTQISSPLARTGSEGDLYKGSLEQKTEEKKPKKPKKIRTPAWTDRILLRSSKRVLHQLLYGCFQSITVSDHRPVVGAFIMEVKKFNEDAVESTLQEARRIIDLQEMAAIPRCVVSPTILQVGNVVYRQQKQLSVSIENTGEVPAAYSFVPAFSGQHITRSPFPKWMSASPTSGVIKAGIKENLEIKLCIEGGQWGSADELFGTHTDELDHILVLHVEGGSDFFISVIGTFTLSCFGLSLNNLARHLPADRERLTKMKTLKPIELPSLEYKLRSKMIAEWECSVFSVDSEHDQSVRGSSDFSKVPQKLNSSNSLSRTGPQPNLVEGPTGLMIPSHVLRMLHFLVDEHGLKTPGLFVESWKQVTTFFEYKSEMESVVAIREALDKGDDFPEHINAHDMAGALLTFFFDLPSPMIPESIAQTCEISDLQCEVAIPLLEEAMSATEWGVFDATMEVMRSALLKENSSQNKLTSHDLAHTCSQVFFQYLDQPESIGVKGVKKADEMSRNLRILNERRCKFIEFSLKLEEKKEKPLIDIEGVNPRSQSFHVL